MLDGVNFAKDYQMDSYNKRIFIEKKKDDKNILGTLKNSKNVSKLLQNFKASRVFYHI
jgi:hypothetical protein